MTGPRTDHPTPLDVVARHEAAALAALDAATGGAPLCRVDGRRLTVKAGEGAAAAISDVRRALIRDGGDAEEAASIDRAQSVIDSVRQRWDGITGPLAARPGTDEYLSGGREALTSLEAEVHRSSLGGPPAPEGDRPSPDEPRGSGVARVLAGTPPLAPFGDDRRVPGESLRWTRRRRVVAGVLMVAVVALVAATVGWPLATAPLWSALTALVVVLSSLALALFVPRAGEGWRPDLGCAPCAAAGLALAVAGPWLAIETAHQDGRAALAAALAAAAFIRKVTEPPVCAKP